MSKIIIIDDDPDILEALQLILENEGYQTETARREVELSKKLQSFHPDLVVLDVLLSGEDGRVICRHLKAHPATSTIKVLMISAHLAAQDSTKCFGADDFLEKPFDIGDLLGRINNLLKSN